MGVAIFPFLYLWSYLITVLVFGEFRTQWKCICYRNTLCWRPTVVSMSCFLDSFIRRLTSSHWKYLYWKTFFDLVTMTVNGSFQAVLVVGKKVISYMTVHSSRPIRANQSSPVQLDLRQQIHSMLCTEWIKSFASVPELNLVELLTGGSSCTKWQSVIYFSSPRKQLLWRTSFCLWPQPWSTYPLLDLHADF